MIQRSTMAGRRFIRVLFILLLTAGTAFAGDGKVSYPPVPDWVKPAGWSPFTNTPDAAKTEGTRYLLYEEQFRPKSAERYVHLVQLMENNNGVQDSGSVSLSFDPSFEELQIHQVVIHRRGKTIDRLDPAKVKIIQPESELGDDMFTGEQKAVLFVEDLRVGDVLEYSYTIRGANPVLGGHFSTTFNVEYGASTEHEYLRVLWDGTAPLQQRSYQTEQPPVVQTSASGTEYAWDFPHPRGISFEDFRPAGFEPYAYVELSDFADWGEVVNWALPLYDTGPTNLPPEMAEQVAQWQNSAGSDEERARLALQFVQDDLRYTGIELGPDSYRPANPVETFQKRFGDCKGKVALLRCLLRQMGITSYPALVNSSVRGAIASHLPSPFAFNHVILIMELDGQTIWVDPTYSRQGGTLWNRQVPPYGKALIIRPGIHALADVPVDHSDNARRQKVTSTFDIVDYHQAAKFTVRTEYFGASADDMRDQVAGTAADELAKSYLNFYTRLYPGITADAPVKITDDRTANIIIAVETYLVTNLWVQDESDQAQTASFYADNLYHTLTDPDTRQRKSPLALSYPTLRQQEIVVHLPEADWDVPALRTNLENRYFSFSYHRLLTHGSTMTYDYECRTKLATVPADLVPDYLVQLDRYANLLTDTLQHADGKTKAVGASGVNWLTVLIALLGSAGTVAGGIWYWRRSAAAFRKIPPALNVETRFQGLRGWLLILGLFLGVKLIYQAVLFQRNFQAYFSLHIWQSVALPGGDSYHPYYGIAIVLELLAIIALLGWNLLVLCLYFRKRRGFPRCFHLFVFSSAIFIFADYFVTARLFPEQNGVTGDQYSVSLRALGYAIIWSSYVYRSRRVKATFAQ